MPGGGKRPAAPSPPRTVLSREPLPAGTLNLPQIYFLCHWHRVGTSGMGLIIAGDRGGSCSRPGAASRALFSGLLFLSSAAERGKNKQGSAAPCSRCSACSHSYGGVSLLPPLSVGALQGPSPSCCVRVALMPKGMSFSPTPEPGIADTALPPGCQQLPAQSRVMVQPSLCCHRAQGQGCQPVLRAVVAAGQGKEQDPVCKHTRRHHSDGWPERGAGGGSKSLL